MNKGKDVHTEHCCKICGCKYGDDTPSQGEFLDYIVKSGVRKQSFEHGKLEICGPTIK